MTIRPVEVSGTASAFVTYGANSLSVGLETEQPTAPSITLRPATNSEKAYVLQLEEACMRRYAEALWGTWRAAATVSTLDITGHEIIERNSEVVGCVAVTWHPDCLFIDKLYVEPGLQGYRIGSTALKRKTEEAAAKGLPTRLSVLTTNPADRFYLREGFLVETETRERRRMMKPVGS